MPGFKEYLSQKKNALKESHSMRGYYEWTYDVKKRKLTRGKSGVASENGIGFFETYYDNDEIIDDYKKGTLTFWEEPDMREDEILGMIREFFNDLKLKF